jgi:hypothetical protein
MSARQRCAEILRLIDALLSGEGPSHGDDGFEALVRCDDQLA